MTSRVKTSRARPTRANRLLLIGVALALTAAVPAVASAADVVRVGKASATTFAFAVVDIAKEKGIWAKYNLDVEAAVSAATHGCSRRWSPTASTSRSAPGPAWALFQRACRRSPSAAMANERSPWG